MSKYLEFDTPATKQAMDLAVCLPVLTTMGP